jgi:hypothetical protein
MEGLLYVCIVYIINNYIGLPTSGLDSTAASEAPPGPRNVDSFPGVLTDFQHRYLFSAIVLVRPNLFSKTRNPKPTCVVLLFVVGMQLLGILETVPKHMLESSWLGGGR